MISPQIVAILSCTSSEPKRGRTVHTRAGACALLVAACVAGCAASAAGAAPSDRGTAGNESAIPLPPPRPAEFGGRRHDLVKRGLQEAPTPRAPLPAVVVATMPRALPPATRERMHACGLEWQQIKWTGSAGERTWRDFAMECLPR